MLPSHASVVVAGGGPAGYMAAITAAEAGITGVLVLEATAEPLHKVLISGGGRCNVTHACWDPLDLVAHYPRGAQALRGPFSRFATADTVSWFAAHGLELVEEADGRLFPRSNRSTSVVSTLRAAAAAAGVQVGSGQAVQGVEPRPGGGFHLRLRGGSSLSCNRLVLATGSHPSGHRIAAGLGHGLIPPAPSLFTLTLADHLLGDLAGVTMDPVVLELQPMRSAPHAPAGKGQRGERFRQRGAVLITHWGLSGPATLRLTAFAARFLKEQRYRGELLVDWTGGRSVQELESLFAETRRSHSRRRLANARPWHGLSRRLWLHLLAEQGVEADLRWTDLGKSSQQALITALRRSCYLISGRGPFGEEFVTAGGIPLGEVNLATMESRLRPGLFLVGELLDVDGVTGGFNFQHCWSSGWLSGMALANGKSAI
jgi:predicted Rossmann fold flavoprotein